MKISNLLSCYKPQNQIVADAHKITITAPTPENSHLFRMMDIHGKCQEIELRMLNRIALQQIEREKRDQISRDMFKD